MAVVLVTIAVTAAPALAQEFYQRRAAHNAGDYAAALGHWRPLAEKGHADAQAALGYMYWNGQGVTQDDATATDWYLRAARQQQPNVVYALGTMYLAGEGVQKDYLRAYVLCATWPWPGAMHAGSTATMMPPITSPRRKKNAPPIWWSNGRSFRRGNSGPVRLATAENTS